MTLAQSTPATNAQIAEALDILFKTMRFHPGVDEDRALFGYMQAMQGFTIEAIAAGVRKFIRGECSDVNPKYVPHPPELARIVRTAVVPQRIPAERRIAPYREPLPGERDRMRLKMPMWQAAYGNAARLDALARANAEGFEAMVVLAASWGVPVPQELLDMPGEEAARQWRQARNRAWDEIDRNPPPFLRNSRKYQFRQAAE
jgi:hypothetical protein